MANCLLQLPIKSVDLWTGTFEVSGKVVFVNAHDVPGRDLRVCAAVLADGTGPRDAIELTAFGDVAARLEPLLRLGSVVTIRRAKVQCATHKYMALQHDFALQAIKATDAVPADIVNLQDLQFRPPLTKLRDISAAGVMAGHELMERATTQGCDDAEARASGQADAQEAQDTVAMAVEDLAMLKYPWLIPQELIDMCCDGDVLLVCHGNKGVRCHSSVLALGSGVLKELLDSTRQGAVAAEGTQQRAKGKAGAGGGSGNSNIGTAPVQLPMPGDLAEHWLFVLTQLYPVPGPPAPNPGNAEALALLSHKYDMPKIAAMWRQVSSSLRSPISTPLRSPSSTLGAHNKHSDDSLLAMVRWRIRFFSDKCKSSDIICSEPFVALGRQWRLDLFPAGWDGDSIPEDDDPIGFEREGIPQDERLHCPMALRLLEMGALSYCGAQPASGEHRLLTTMEMLLENHSRPADSIYAEHHHLEWNPNFWADASPLRRGRGITLTAAEVLEQDSGWLRDGALVLHLVLHAQPACYTAMSWEHCRRTDSCYVCDSIEGGEVKDPNRCEYCGHERPRILTMYTSHACEGNNGWYVMKWLEVARSLQDTELETKCMQVAGQCGWYAPFSAATRSDSHSFHGDLHKLLRELGQEQLMTWLRYTQEQVPVVNVD